MTDSGKKIRFRGRFAKPDLDLAPEFVKFVHLLVASRQFPSLLPIQCGGCFLQNAAIPLDLHRPGDCMWML